MCDDGSLDLESESYWLDDFQGDKYTVDAVYIDCNSRIHKCKAACCRLQFALTRQDLTEASKMGIMLWNPELKYCISQTDNNYCCQSNQENYACKIYSYRPYKCRIYDCRSDKRIWKDYERMEVNPETNNSRWPLSLIENVKNID